MGRDRERERERRDQNARGSAGEEESSRGAWTAGNEQSALRQEELPEYVLVLRDCHPT